LILLSHLPDEKPFSSDRFDITYIECVQDSDYSRSAQAAWSVDEPLILIEHDMEVSDDLIQRLLDDLAPLVTHAYLLHWVSSGKPAAYCQRVGDFPPGRRYLGQPIEEGVTVADFTGLGFCKISPEARARPLEESSWQFVDTAVDAAVDGRWRVLWPEVEHHHV
jgi:hypothetical protein